jgi:hypothetical protein
MSLNENSYGSVEEVATLVARYTTTGAFTTTTRPTIAQVEQFIDRLSARLNVYLAEAGFAIPVTQADAVMALADFVVTTVVDYCHWANSAGRFVDTKTLKGRSAAALVDEEASQFVAQHADGLEALGATRTRSMAYGMFYREFDDAGDAIIPMFQRKMAGWKLRDWDSSAVSNQGD